MKAMPTDWRDSRKRPFLHIGQPCERYNSLKPEKVFPSREIKGEEIASLTGCFRQGQLENLIAFSDTYFVEAQEMWKFTNIYSGKKIENEEERPGGGRTFVYLRKVQKEGKELEDGLCGAASGGKGTEESGRRGIAGKKRKGD